MSAVQHVYQAAEPVRMRGMPFREKTGSKVPITFLIFTLNTASYPWKKNRQPKKSLAISAAPS